ncbi:MAG: hypothetical protein JXB46_01660 [Candidatus Eisenbacteria bacterium]|nr:hypothetical protein [Candidatus Eisenbacteria bacterium]
MRSSITSRLASGIMLSVFLAILAIVPHSGVRAASTSYWKTDTFAQASAGRLEGTSVLSDGSITLSPEIEKINLPESQYVWGGVIRKDGALVLATGTPGRVYALNGGDAQVLLSEDTVDFPVIAASPSGRVFVGTAPGGRVYRIDPDGTTELFFETGQGYVWSMAFSEEHGLIVGTGDSARVYAVDPDGRGEIIYETDETSVSAVGLLDNTVLAGTTLSGTVLDITPGGDLRVLYDTEYEEISSIIGRPGGAVCFSAMSVSMDDVIDDNGTGSGGYGEGSVYVTTESGGAVELWRSGEAPITALGAAHDGTLLVGTGSEGLVYSVDADGNVGLCTNLDGEEVLSIGVGTRLVLTAGAPGGAYLMASRPGRAGSYVSEVFDTRSSARWGALSWDMETPSGSGIGFSVRSGNTEEPGETWSDWVDVRGSDGGTMDCPPARFLQWRAELTRGGSDDSSPLIRSVSAAYLPENLPPVVRAVAVLDPGGAASNQGAARTGSSIKQSLPGGVEVTYSTEPEQSPARDLPMLVRGMRTASWTATDPNDDTLIFDIYIRSDKEEEWKLMEKGIEWRTLHTWDTQTMPDGIYRLKVIASDRPDNPDDSALTGSAASHPFLIDHTPPEVILTEVSLTGAGLLVNGIAEDEASPVAGVEVAVDYGDWRPAFAEDGIFDSRKESFALRIESLEPGEHGVSLRAFDRAGNPIVVREVVR